MCGSRRLMDIEQTIALYDRHARKIPPHTYHEDFPTKVVLRGADGRILPAP